jgi:hypothetical protein
MFSTSERPTQPVSSKSSVYASASKSSGRSLETLQFSSGSLKRASSASASQGQQRQVANPQLAAIFQGGQIFQLNRTAGDVRQASVTTLQQSYQGGKWFFYNNGQFVFQPQGIGTVVSSSLYPITGTYRATQSSLSFSGSRTASVTTGRTTVALQGSITASSNGTLVGRMVQEVSSVGAAVVGGQGFGGNQYKYIDFSMTMARTA